MSSGARRDRFRASLWRPRGAERHYTFRNDLTDDRLYLNKVTLNLLHGPERKISQRAAVAGRPAVRRKEWTIDTEFEAKSDSLHAVHNGQTYAEPVLNLFSHHDFLLVLHNDIIYKMHDWGRCTPFRSYLRQNCPVFPRRDIPFAIRSIIIYDHEFYHVSWHASDDGLLYLAPTYKNQIDIYAGKKIDVAASVDAHRLIYATTDKMTYFSAEDTPYVELFRGARQRFR